LVKSGIIILDTSTFIINMEQALVSIALRSYNQKAFLKEAIDSILSQTYQNIEIIIADDASTDGSVEMIKNFYRKFPEKIRPLFNETNIGHTLNFNKALFACTGRYIAIFDGDDIMLPEKIEKQVKLMDENPQCIVSYHNTEYFDNDTGKHLYFKNNKRNSHQGGVKTMIKYGMFCTNVSCMVRRDKIPEKGANQQITIASDWLFYIETLMNGGQICYIDEVLARVRRHSENITQKRFLKNLIDQYLSSFILIMKYPKYMFLVFYRWFDGLWNQFKTNILKKYN
jgi:glycosyltransferase involved in cell wall biosynthesis